MYLVFLVYLVYLVYLCLGVFVFGIVKQICFSLKEIHLCICSVGSGELTEYCFLRSDECLKQKRFCEYFAELSGHQRKYFILLSSRKEYKLKPTGLLTQTHLHNNISMKVRSSVSLRARIIPPNPVFELYKI